MRFHHQAAVAALALSAACGARGPSSTAYPASGNRDLLSFVGRAAETADKQVRMSWPGTRLDFRFQGTGAAVDIRHRKGLFGGDTMRSWFDVVVDGAPAAPVAFGPEPGAKNITGAVAAGTHTVTMTKRTEALVGACDFFGLEVEAGTLVSPAARKDRRIEVISASAATGYGIEPIDCSKVAELFDVAQNQSKAWPQVLADSLGAELMNSSFSGKGVVGFLFEPPGNTAMPALYPLSDPSDLASTPWDFSAWTADAVLVDLSNIDWRADPSHQSQDGSTGLGPDPAAYQRANEAFVATIAGAYPKAKIYFVVSGVVDAENKPSIQSALAAIAAASKAKGIDAQVHEMAPASGGRLACEQHPSVEMHQQMAQDMAKRLRADLGWQ